MTTKQTTLEEEPKGMASLQIRDENDKLVSWEDFGQMDWEDDGTDDVQPAFPMIKIVQGTSTMEGAGKHGGDFWHSDTEEYESTISVVALVKRETRALFEEGRVEPSCLSVDGKVPLPNQPKWAGQVQPAACVECPFSAWGEDNTPPPCKNSEVLLVDRGNGDLAQLRVNGKSIKPLRQFIARKCKPKSLPLYAYRLTLGTRELSGDGKKWHELTLSGELMQPAEAKVYSDMLRAQREQFEQTLRATTDTEAVEWTEDPADLPSREQGGGWESL